MCQHPPNPTHLTPIIWIMIHDTQPSSTISFHVELSFLSMFFVFPEFGQTEKTTRHDQQVQLKKLLRSHQSPVRLEVAFESVLLLLPYHEHRSSFGQDGLSCPDSASVLAGSALAIDVGRLAVSTGSFMAGMKMVLFPAQNCLNACFSM
jgi:hypothetical protein